MWQSGNSITMQHFAEANDLTNIYSRAIFFDSYPENLYVIKDNFTNDIFLVTIKRSS